MSEFKLNNNIYGILTCHSSLETACKVLRYNLGLSSSEVYISKSQLDGCETLKVSTDIYDLATETTDLSCEYLFNGKVAGDDSGAILRVKNIAEIFNKIDCKYSFEIYNNRLDFVYKYPQEN